MFYKIKPNFPFHISEDNLKSEKYLKTHLVKRFFFLLNTNLEIGFSISFLDAKVIFFIKMHLIFEPLNKLGILFGGKEEPQGKSCDLIGLKKSRLISLHFLIDKYGHISSFSLVEVYIFWTNYLRFIIYQMGWFGQRLTTQSNSVIKARDWSFLFNITGFVITGLNCVLM